MFLWVWTLVIITSLVTYFRRSYSKFKRDGVNHLPPAAPLGNLFRTTLCLEHLVYNITRIYNAFPNDRFIGIYEFVNPVVVIRDLDLIKQITFNDFEHFVDHRNIIDENNDKLFGRNLFSLKGSEWRDMKSILSPAFTSSKIRLMVPFMWEIGQQMNQVLKEKIETSNTGSIDVDGKDITTRYANDVFATCAFGIKINSHVDENNVFYQEGYKVVNFDFIQLLKFFGFSSCPKLMRISKVSLLSKSTQEFFRNLVTGIMKDREERNVVRHDVTHLLMEAKKGKLTHDDTAREDIATVDKSSVEKTKIMRVWGDDDLIAQVIVLFIAAFDTVSSAMTFILCELALNPDVQDKLVKEIRETDDKHNGEIDFNAIQQMEYMDMNISEVLRKWSPAALMDRICVKDYNLGRPNISSTRDYIIRKGEAIWIPVWSIQHNPDYFADPEKFDPERFNQQNRNNIKPFTYMPFGLGPRNCIGYRFALCEIKVMVYQLLRDFQVLRSEKLSMPVRLAAGSLNIRINGGGWVKLMTRNHE